MGIVFNSQACVSFSAWVVLTCLFCGGCNNGDSRVATVPVTGLVLKGGKPIHYATVVFHPSGDTPVADAKPRAITSADGTFELTTYDGNDGAPEGEYKVTIQQWLTEKPEEGPKNQLKEKYADPNTSQLTATVRKEGSSMFTFKVD